MNAERLQDAIAGIDDAFIDDAAGSPRVYINLRAWMPVAAVAACILLATVLLPWRTILSLNDPFGRDPFQSGAPTDVLQNDETSSNDSTGEKNDIPGKLPVESTQDSKYEDSTDSAISPDTFEKTDTDDAVIPPQILPPVSDVPKLPDTTGPYQPPQEDPDGDETTSADEETTGPFLPIDPPSPPDHGTIIQPRPIILSRCTYPLQEQYPTSSTQYYQWNKAKEERINGFHSGIGNTDAFMSVTIGEFFSNSKSENLIYSPINAYMTLGMLSETAAGSSRDQLLGLLGENDILSLRRSANNLWNACYRDDGIVTSVFGSSMWLDNSFAPKSEVTDILAESYYASSFYGKMGDKEYDELMHSWINEETRGTLGDAVSDTALDPESTVSLMSTTYFKASWAEEFDTEVTRNWTFHSTDGDISVPFMYKDFIGLLYEGASFKATYLDLKEGGEMWFILPDENVTPQSLFKDQEAMGFITGKTQKTLAYDKHQKYMWLFLPKFDVSSGADLAEGLKNIGISEVFEEGKADFSTLTDSSIFVRDITQTARVCIDEKGCEAASASGSVVPGEGGLQEFGFTFDRPFIFVVTSDTGIPVFVGTVFRP